MDETPPATPEQEAASPVPNKAGSTTPQPPPATEGSAQLAPNETSIGERWGEFPPEERQAELRKRMEAWEQETDHGDRLGPFDGVGLNAAEVFWLATLVVTTHYYGGVAPGDLRFRYNELPPPSGLPVGPDTRTFWLSLNLSNLHLEGASFYGVNLEGVQLTGAQLQGAHLSRARLSGAHLTKAQLQEADLYYGQLQDAVVGNACLTGAWLEDALLTGAILSGSDLQGANLMGAKLQHAWLSGAKMQAARLNMAHLEDADLTDAQLYSASLWSVNLQEAKLVRAQLQEADLSGTRLQGADLRKARMDRNTRLDGIKLDTKPDLLTSTGMGFSLSR
ncbi:MAG TPA: pentapeptide repeat-containing protein [Ktedonobacterales bacterium]|nr:pentapeptide repeat-containing protein [Ktedonobacterales bacterium]